MFNGYVYTSTIFAFIFIILGLLVFLRNTKQWVNRQFLIFSIFAACWLVTNYFAGTSETPESIAVLANRLVLAFAAGMAGALLAFVISFSGTKIKLTTPIVLLNGLAAGFCLTSLVVTDVAKQGVTYFIDFGPLSLFYFLVLAADLILIITILFRSYNRATGVLKLQLGVISFSFAVSLTAMMITNAVMPSVFNSYSLTNAGTLMMAVLVGGIAYTIIRHKLFDIRLVVARSLAYILVVAVLGIGYSILSLTLISNLIDDTNRVLSTAANTLLIIFAAISFTPLKAFFDKITNRFFYQDAYDAQEFLDTFNKNLVATYDLQSLLKKSAAIIEHHIKPTYVLFGIKETATTPRRLMGSGAVPSFTEKDIAFVRALTPKLRKKVIITDDIGPERAEFKQVLQDNNISVLLRLAAKTNEEGTGYLILGPKKSGNIYSARDINTLEIIANELVIAILNALRTEEIENFNLTLQQKVNDATHKLRRTNEKLKALDETKDDFISMASHQLRTPLTSVKGYISMVLEEDAGKITPMQREMLGQAFFSSQRMVYLIADLLNVSRLKTGKFVIERSPIQLDQIVQQEMRQLQETAASRSLTLEYKQPESFPPMLLDETKTRQIIMNFIDNAIYYTPSGGRITVRLINNDQSVEFRVEDNGIGVPKAEQQHLFTKFFRAGNARQARPDGTGLGLFMAKKVIVAQGGSILFESEEGKGSTFGFIFSKSLAADNPTPGEPAIKELHVTPAPDTKK